MKDLIRMVLVLVLISAPAVHAATVEMRVNGLVCAFCAQGIEKKLRKIPATAEVVVNLENRLVAVRLRDGQDVSDADLRKALTDAGYVVTSIQRTNTSIGELRERLKQGRR